MQFVAALLEYFVAGVLAMAWVAPLVWRLWGTLPSMSNTSTIVFLAVAYALGLVIDTSASRILQRRKWRVQARGQAYADAVRPYERTVQVLALDPESLAQTMLVYNSRDRIMRSVTLNAAISVPVLLLTLPQGIHWKASAASLVVLIWSYFVWKRLDRLSSQFKEAALNQLPAVRRESPVG